MNKKISLGLAIALIVLSVTASFAITMSVSQLLPIAGICNRR